MAEYIVDAAPSLPECMYHAHYAQVFDILILQYYIIMYTHPRVHIYIYTQTMFTCAHT